MDFNEYSHELSNALYIPESFPTEAAGQQYEYQLEGCSCKSECRLEAECICSQRSGTYYHFENLKDVKTYRIKEKNEAPSYECNDNCKCTGHFCGNRLVQFGPRENLMVKQCDITSKGLGLFTSSEIEKGSFICQYAGEITSEEEARHRYNIYLQNNDLNYIFCIKEKFGNKVLKTFIDATIYANIGRYINHSCDANCDLYIIRINNMTPILAIFANMDIPKGTEITYDYGNNTSIEMNSKRKKCLCLSADCKNYLPYETN